jgi:hypothetical protein
VVVVRQPLREGREKGGGSQYLEDSAGSTRQDIGEEERGEERRGEERSGSLVLACSLARSLSLFQKRGQQETWKSTRILRGERGEERGESGSGRTEAANGIWKFG